MLQKKTHLLMASMAVVQIVATFNVEAQNHKG
jgi:hypothetical protein